MKFVILLFSVLFNSIKNLEIVFILDKGSGGYESVSVFVKEQKTY